ncbi:hypothetical protein LEMLEM_LOCUS27673 [Lemmus lemmus]
MCDFGISGYLVDSVAKTIDAGCKPYMAVSSAPRGVCLCVYVCMCLCVCVRVCMLVLRNVPVVIFHLHFNK